MHTCQPIRVENSQWMQYNVTVMHVRFWHVWLMLQKGETFSRNSACVWAAQEQSGSAVLFFPMCLRFSPWYEAAEPVAWQRGWCMGLYYHPSWTQRTNYNHRLVLSTAALKPALHCNTTGSCVCVCVGQERKWRLTPLPHLPLLRWLDPRPSISIAREIKKLRMTSGSNYSVTRDETLQSAYLASQQPHAHIFICVNIN